MPGLPVLVVTQYVEQICAREPLACGTGGIGYLLKDRASDGAQFVDAVRRVADGGTATDPEVIARLLDSSTADGALGSLSLREREVLAIMAEGRSTAAIPQRMFITERAVAKHTSSIVTGCRTAAQCASRSPTRLTPSTASRPCCRRRDRTRHGRAAPGALPNARQRLLHPSPGTGLRVRVDLRNLHVLPDQFRSTLQAQHEDAS
jgi:DNA-binding CsgD family transcriptional regulator